MFIQSRNLVENGGLIVAKARHVELAGGTGVVSFRVHLFCAWAHTQCLYHTLLYKLLHVCVANKTNTHQFLIRQLQLQGLYLSHPDHMVSMYMLYIYV